MLLKSALVNNLASSKDGGGGTTKSVTITTPSKEKPAVTTPDTASTPSQPPALAKESSTTTPAHAYSREALKALGGGIGDSIVDLRVSSSETQEQALSRNGYVQVLQESAILNAMDPRRSNNAVSQVAATTFNNKTSIWLWRRSQGTCSGRLKPIIDIILYSTGVSSDLVLAGYSCDPVTIAGHYVWVKRATTEEEEKDSIIDLFVTTGRMKDASDPIWQTPGVGWIRIDGNFTKSLFGSVDSFLWYRPARSRSMDMQMTNPLKGAVALTEDIRQTKLVGAVRIGLRHYVSVADIKRLSNLVMESKETGTNTVTSSAVRSERLMDFSTVFHLYADSKGRMNSSRFAKLLHDVGLNMKSNDASLCFNFFDLNHNGTITIDEYIRVLALTDYELDLALEKIRLKLLMPCVPKELQKQASATLQSQSTNVTSNKMSNALIGSKTDIGVIGAQSIINHPFIGKNKIRENMTLSQIFNMINSKNDSILSLDEILDLSAKVEVFLTEEEARKVSTIMDMDGDDRVEEPDFIAFMRKESTAIVKKAFRIRESAALLRRWLVRGTSEKIDANSTATASNQQWKEFKHRYEKSTGQKFPGFISARVLQLTLALQGLRLSSTEARELALVVAPDKNGRIHLAELHAFMGRSCRSFGELIALLQRELMTDLVESYRAYRMSVKATGKDDPDLFNIYKKKLDEIKKVVEKIYSKIPNNTNGNTDSSATGGSTGARDSAALQDIHDPTGAGNRQLSIEDDDENDDELQHQRQVPVVIPTPTVDPFARMRKANHEVISIAQLKLGLQDAFASKRVSEAVLPNHEEWACLAILVDADVAEGDVYGVRLKNFLEGVCQYIYATQFENHWKLNDKMQLEIVSRDLRLQLYREARMYSNTKKLKAPDYQTVFNLFDENKNGVISLVEFKKALRRYQLVELPENQTQALLAMFDKRKTGSIGFEDFRAFAEQAADEGLDESDALLESSRLQSDLMANEMPKSPAVSRSMVGDERKTAETNNYDSDLDDNDDTSLLLSDSGGAAPASITSDADCDWLCWHLYRQAYRVDPMDAEGVLCELETICTETEVAQNTKITVKDMWNMLYELRLQGKMTKQQFLSGIAFVCDFGTRSAANSAKGRVTTDADRVDFAALCKYSIRMGRAFMSNVQEKNKVADKKYPDLFADLKRYFKSLCEDSQKDDPNAVPRYEKIFRRLDSDGDGMLTVREFRKGLRQLQYRDASEWTSRLTKRLFDACDTNRDGLLSIKEFSLSLLDKQTKPRPSSGITRDSRNGTPARGTADQSIGYGIDGEAVGSLSISVDRLNLSDNEDEGDEDFFRKKVALTDTEIIRKVNEILMDIVPKEAGASAAQHLEVVRQSVRRFFQRADPEFSGAVTEERFRAFLRRSGLQDALTASELRRLTEKLKKRGSGRDRFEAMIDYEKLCQHLLVATESIPKSKAETVFRRFQDASVISAGAGRSFMNLCSLLDLKLTGRISKEEFIHISKMMDCELSISEVDSLLEWLPNVVIANFQRGANGKDSIDYRALNSQLQSITPREMDSRLFSSGADYSNATNPLSSTLSNSRAWNNGNQFNINTPLGQSISTPMRPLDSQSLALSSPYFAPNALLSQSLSSSAFQNNLNGAGNSAIFDKIIRAFADRTRQAIDERSRSWNTHFSLRKKLETLDLMNSGQVGVRALQMALEEVGVVPTSSELQALCTVFGRPDDDKLFYDSLCRQIEGQGSNGGAAPLNRASDPVRRDSRDRDLDRSTAVAASSEAYLSARVVQRYRELKQDNRHPLDMFMVYDLDRTGMVTVSKFRDVIRKLQLMQTEHQLARALEDFAAIGNKSYVNYEDFCDALEKSARSVAQSLDVSQRLSSTRPLRQSAVLDGDGYDGLRSGRSNLPGDEIINSGRDDDREYYESLHRVANQNAHRERPSYFNSSTELDAGSDGQFMDYALSPPKMSDSISFQNNNYNSSGTGNFNASSQWATSSAARRGSASPTRLSRSMVEPVGASSLHRARTSPSKIGTKMWGTDTPLSRKGSVPHVDDDKWCCAVCLYVENPVSADHCLVCDSPNYNNMKDYQVKEQCRNCTFLNGQFAEECEMCGERLANRNAKKPVSTPASSNRYRRDVY